MGKSGPQNGGNAEEYVMKYKQLAQSIRAIEDDNVFKIYKVKKDELEQLDAEIKTLSEKQKAAAQSVEKEKSDVDKLQSISYYFKDQPSAAEMTKEQEEYVQALNKLEMVNMELATAKQRQADLKQELSAYQKKADELEKLYKAQDQLLDKIFRGKYGSNLENMLESQVDSLTEWKQRIGLAHSKWTSARKLVSFAVDKIVFALQKFQEVNRYPHNEMAPKYQCATEARNSLIEAIQSITAAQQVLPKISFPYCKQDELQQFAVTLSSIYGDIQDQQRFNRSLQIYSQFHERAVYLLQWMEHVIKNTIHKDYNEASLNLGKATSALYAERIRLIGGSNDRANDLESPKKVPPPETKQETSSNAKDLPPPPSQEEIFGNIEHLKKEHEKAMEEFDRTQETNKARIDQALQEKLEARRTRRARQQVQEQMSQ